MILNDKDALRRLSSPLNLINQLNRSSNNRKNAMTLFTGSKKEVISSVPHGMQSDAISSGKSANGGVTHPPENTSSFNPFINKDSASINPKELILSSSKTYIPIPPKLEIPPAATIDTILEDHESQIKLGLAHDRALDLLNKSVEMLSAKLEDVRADKLPSVVSAASKTVDAIRRERNESSKNSKDREVHYHFYTPQQRKVEDYEVIDVSS